MRAIVFKKSAGICGSDLPLEEGPEAYRKFDRREDGYTKVILKPLVRSGASA